MFRVISVDPPWHFKTWGKTTGRSPQDHYDVMTLDDIKRIPVADLADPAGSACVLWSIWPLGPQCFDVMRAWGFEYKTVAFVWFKRSTQGTTWHKGLGYYTRSNTEFAILGTLGDPPTVFDKGVDQLVVDVQEQLDLPGFGVTAPLLGELTDRVGQHSEKPGTPYRRLERLFGDVPRVELFARRPRPGWVTLGNEIDGKHINRAIADLVAERKGDQ